jgi:type II secretion system protein N
MAQLAIAPNFGLSGFRRALAITIAAVALTTFFLISGFPYDRLAPRVAATLESLTGARVSIGGLDLGMSWFAPQLRASQVQVTWPGAKPVAFESLRVHPAVSMSWFRGAPALAIALSSPLGEADGTVVVGAEPGFDGELRNVSLALLPIGDVAAGTSIDGRADATIDLAMSEAGLQGSVRFEAKNGSLTLPVLPIGVPFEKLTGDLALGGDVVAKLTSLDLAGPLVALTASGTIGKGATTELSPLALSARIEAREPAVRSLLQRQGVALDANGGAAVTIDGTLGAPNIVPARGPGRAG